MAGAFIASAADREAGRRRRMWYAKPMKAVQATFDEGLLDKLDCYCAARASGRSAAIREAVADYLRRKEAEDAALRYQAGYGAAPADADLSGWADEGVWPE